MGSDVTSHFVTTSDSMALFLLLCLLSTLPQVSSIIATVYKHENGKFFVREVYDGTGLAAGNYTDASLNPSFFGELHIETGRSHEDEDQAFAAGFVEGYLTEENVYQAYQNLMCQVNCSGYPGDDSPIVRFFAEQDEWLTHQIKRRSWDPLFKYVELLRLQQEGLMAGYNSRASKDKQLPWWAFTLLNSIGDLFDIVPAVNKTARPDPQSMSHKEIMEYVAKNGHCSALVKVTGDMSEMYFGHSSWFIFSDMLRIYKQYHLRYRANRHANQRVSFSSYPGMISSLDDFYMMHDTKLSMIQTTNAVLNPDLFDLVTSKGLLAWHRVQSANALATSGKQWANIVSVWNSGTYNNQYMIVDVDKFTPGNALQDNLLWVVEQIPGDVISGDVTKELRRGYWPSYNIPYWRKAYAKSGYTFVDDKKNLTHGSSYELAPRAKIFRRDQASVVDFKSYKKLMRSNNYKTDPYAEGSPYGAICSRGDLAADHPLTNGCYDTKATTWSMFNNNGRVHIVNGPTTNEGELPPFSWAKFNHTPHYGMPEVWNFTFQEFMLPW